jgi:prepilin-type processing-associated H-X9-DG protein
MYAEDFNGRVAPNQAGSFNSWVGDIMSFDGNNSDVTNAQKLLDPAWSKLGPYIQSVPNFKCPSDPSEISIYRVMFPRVRSYSMNSAVGFQGPMNDLPFNWGFWSYKKQSDMVSPSPAQLWVITEEHPDGIDDCVFTVDCSSQFNGARFISVPAHYHYGSANFSFADGHVENHRWVDPNTFVPEKYCGCLAHYANNGYYTEAPNSRDVAWLQAHSSSRLP